MLTSLSEAVRVNLVSTSTRLGYQHESGRCGMPSHLGGDLPLTRVVRLQHQYHPHTKSHHYPARQLGVGDTHAGCPLAAHGFCVTSHMRLQSRAYQLNLHE